MRKNLLNSKVLSTISLLMLLLFVSSAFGQVTKTWVGTSGGVWTTAANWSPSGVPTSTDHVLIPTNQSAAITRASSDGEVIDLKGLTISGNVNFQFDPGSANVCTLNITGTLDVDAGKTFTAGITNAGRLDVILALTATGTINGTVYINSYNMTGYDRNFTNDGDLTVAGAGLITCQNTSLFNNTGTLAITSSSAIAIPVAKFTNTGVLNLQGTGTIAGITNSTGGTVNLTNSGTITSFNNATSTSVLDISDLTPPTITTLTATAAGNTVVYNGAGAQTVKVTTYDNLTLSGSGIKTTTTGVTINGVLDMAGTATTSTALAYGTSATLQYDKTGTAGAEWPTTFSGGGGVLINTGTVTFSGQKIIANALEIKTGAVLNLGTTTTSTAHSIILGGVAQTTVGSYGYTGATVNNTTFFANNTGRISLSAGTTISTTGNGGNWSASTTWAGGIVPGAQDTARILSGDTVTVDIPNAFCAALEINFDAATVATLTFVASGSPKLTVIGTTKVGGSASQNYDGTITFTSGSTLETGSLLVGATGNQIGRITMTAGGYLKVNGAITVSGTSSVFTPGAGTVELTANNTLPATKFTSFNNLIISSGTTTTGVALPTINGDITVKAGAIFTLDDAVGATSGPNNLYLECGATGSTISGASLLTLGGNVAVTKVAGTGTGATISCPVALVNGNTRTFTVADETTLANDLTISGVVSTSGALTKAGLGTMILSGNNTYSGATTISAGTLKLNSTTALGTSSSTTVSGGAVLDLNGRTLTTARPLTLNGTGLAVSPAGALTNTGANASYSGAITLGSDSAITVTSSGTLTCSGNVGGAFGLVLDGLAGTGTMSGIISAPTSLTKNGAGTWVLSGANTYTGATTINAGTLTLGSTKALGATTNNFAISSGAKANVTSNVTVGTLALGGLGKANGTWGSTTSSATNKDNTYFSGSSIVTVSTNSPYKSQIISADLGSDSWCQGETRNVTVTIKNVGTATWTTGTFNIGVKWNTNGTSWNDYNVRTSAADLAPGATTTYTLPLTASDFVVGNGYSSALATGSNNITFDVVYEGVSWFGNNNGGVGPGNTVFTSPAQTILALPTVTSTTPNSKTYTGTANATTVSAVASAGATIDWYDAATNGTLLASSTLTYAPTAIDATSYTVYAQARNTTTGCTSAARTSATLTINAATLTVTANTATHVYGATLTAGAGATPLSVTGMQNAETLAGTVTLAYTAGNTATSAVNTYSGAVSPSLFVKTSGTANLSNYTINYVTNNLSVTAATLTITGLTGANKVYDGLTTATSTGTAAYSGLQNGESFAVTGTPTLNFSDKNVGTGKTITVTGYTAPSANYTLLTQPSLTGNITTAALTITGLTGANKVYDGLTTATSTGTAAYFGLQNSESFAVTGTPTLNFSDKNVGTGKTITVTGYTAPSANYTVTQPSLTGNITKAAVMVTAVTDTKTYNGTTSSSASPTVGSLVSGDVVNVAPTQAYDNKNYGLTHILTASGLTIKDGSAADMTGNYTISYTASPATGIINKTTLTITAASDSKTYDGTTSSSASPTVTSGAIQLGDTAAFIQTYDTKNVGTSKVMTPVGIVIDGNSGNNYSYTFVTSANGTIAATALTITSVSDSKTYDGTTSSSASPTVTSGAIQPGDTAAFIQTYDTKNVGTSKVMTPVGIVIDGNSGNNYSYTFVTSANGTIAATALTITSVSDSKTYDGTTSSSASPTVTSGAIQPGDTAAFIQTYDTKNVGTSKVMTPVGIVIDGNSGSNYSYTFVTSANGIISAAALTITANDASVCEGVTYTLGTTAFTSVGLISGDVIDNVVLTSSTSNPATAGAYSIIPSAATGGAFLASNYVITYSNGSLTVNTTLAASVAISATATTICNGTNVTFTATPTNGGVTPTYQWQVNGADVFGETVSTFSTTTLNDTDYVNVVMTASNGTCGSGSPATSNIITMVVGSSITATIASTDGAGCIGNTVDFTITGTADAVITYNINGDSDTTATLTAGTAVISIPGAAETQVFTLVSVSNGICTTSIGTSATVIIGTSTVYMGYDDVHDAEIWTNGVPTSTMEAVFENDYIMTADFTACSITVNSGNVSVASGKNVFLTRALTVTTGGSFTLNNNANLYQADETTLNSGNIIVKRDTNPLIRLDYTMWGSPVSGQNLFDFSPLTTITPSIRFYTYNTASNSYSSVANPKTTDFVTGIGYLIRLPYNHPTAPAVWHGAFTGVPNNGTQTVTLNNNVEEGKRFNAVGNPYPSPIQISTFALNNASNIESTLYFWRKTNNAASPSYCTWNTDTNTYGDNGEAYTETPNDILQTGQGFIVEAKEAATSLEFNNGQRVVNNANQFFKSSSAVSTAASKEAHRIWLNLKGTDGFSQAVVGYFTNGTLGVDTTDSKFFNDGPIAVTMKIEGNDYIIQGRPVPFDQNDIVPLSYKVTTAGSYNFTIDHVDGLFADGTQDIFIKDKLDGSYHIIGTATPYVFTSEVGTFADRFELVYTNKILSADQNEFNGNAIVIYHQQNDVIINTGATTMETVRVFDIRGRLLISKKNINLSETRINVGTTNQVLLVEVTTTDGLKATKKVIN